MNHQNQIVNFLASTPKMSIWVKIEGNIVKDGAPIIKKFKGQLFANLMSWLEKQGKVTLYKLNIKEEI